MTMQITTARVLSDHDAELQLVGSLLESPASCDAAVDAGLVATDLTDPMMQAVVREALSAHNAGQVSVEAVVARLRRAGDEAAASLALQAYGAGAPVYAVRELADHVIGYAQVRQVATIADALQALVAGDSTGGQWDAKTVIERAAQIAGGIGERDSAADFVGLSTLLGDLYDEWSDRHERGGTITGLSTGFPELDHVLGGLQPSSLIVIGARPGVGKTSLALGIAEHVAFELDRGVAMYSMEMNARELVSRSVAHLASVNAARLKLTAPTAADFERIASVSQRLMSSPERIWIDPSATLTPAELRRKARRLQRRSRGSLGVAIVDYLQLMETGRRMDGRVQEVTYLSRQLKQMAMELDLPVIALSQLNRDIEARGENARPRLKDLRESGSIEQDADVVILLYHTPQPDDLPGELETITALVEKNRHGRIGEIQLKFEPRFTRFVGRP